jgi:hypothetical protein
VLIQLSYYDLKDDETTMSTPGASSDSIAALQTAITLAESGERDAARRQLLTLTADQPTLELAWLWLAAVTDDIDARVAILRQVLSINPANDKARTALVRLIGDESSLPPRPATVAKVPTARTTSTLNAVPAVKTADTATADQRQSGQGLSSLGSVEIVLIVILVVVVLVVVVGGGTMLLGGRFARPTDTPTATNTPLFTATRPVIAPAKSYTPTITPGGPTETPYVLPTLPPSWTPMPSDTPLATYTLRPTETPLATETVPPTMLPPTVIPIPTKGTPPTLPPLPTLPGSSIAATKVTVTKSP